MCVLYLQSRGVYKKVNNRLTYRIGDYFVSHASFSTGAIIF